MVKDTVLRWILMIFGLIILVLILLSDTSPFVKGFGVLFGIFIVAMGIILTGPLRRHFEQTREGTMNPEDVSNISKNLR